MPKCRLVSQIWEDEASSQGSSVLKHREMRVLQCTDTHKQRLWRSLKQVKSCFLSLTGLVQYACIQFFLPTHESPVAASRLLLGAVPRSPLSSAQELYGQVLAGTAPVTCQGPHSSSAGLVPGAGWVTATTLQLGTLRLCGDGSLGAGRAASCRRPSRVG